MIGAWWGSHPHVARCFGVGSTAHELSTSISASFLRLTHSGCLAEPSRTNTWGAVSLYFKLCRYRHVAKKFSAAVMESSLKKLCCTSSNRSPECCSCRPAERGSSKSARHPLPASIRFTFVRALFLSKSGEAREDAAERLFAWSNAISRQAARNSLCAWLRFHKMIPSLPWV